MIQFSKRWRMMIITNQNIYKKIGNLISMKSLLGKSEVCSSTLSGLRTFLVVLRSTGFTYCYSCLTLAGFLENYERQKIPEGLNVNNIRQSLVKERVLLLLDKTPEVFNLIRSGEPPQPEKR